METKPLEETTLVDEAENARVLARLLPGVAHDINSLVGVAVTATTHARGTLSSLSEAVDGSALTKAKLQTGLERLEEALRLIQTNLERTLGLVAGLKHLTGRAPRAAPEPVDIPRLLDDIALAFGPAFRKSPHRLVINAPRTLSLTTLPSELSRVLLNLVQNALIHAFLDETPGTVTVNAALSTNGAILTIEDDGAGMPPEVAARAFEPYYTTRRGEGGTGLGLAIVADLVEKSLEGRLSLETIPGKGTTFRIALPNLVG